MRFVGFVINVSILELELSRERPTHFSSDAFGFVSKASCVSTVYLQQQLSLYM